MNAMEMIFQGFLQNLLVTVLSALLPMAVGIGLTVAMNFTKQTVLPKAFKYLAIGFESLAPILLVLVVYFVFSGIDAMVAVVIAFSFCFLGHLPQKYDNRDSLIKNIVVNGLDLLATIFKWSLAACMMVGLTDMVKAANIIGGRTYDFKIYIIPLLISIPVLLLLYVGRNLCKDLMK